MNTTQILRTQMGFLMDGKPLGDRTISKHLYELGTAQGKVEVHANTRAQARKIAEYVGHVVRDVNMVG
jgi:hypothetical protein